MDATVKKNLLELKAKASAASDAYNKAFKEAFPVGCEVTFKKGKGEVWAEVLHVSAWSNHQSVKIKNLRTGKEYHVYGFWLIEGLKA